LKSYIRQAVASSRAAVAKNWRPFLLIQACTAALVAAYYLIPAASEATATLARIKADGGLLGTALATALASVVLPLAAKKVTGLGKDRFDLADFVFQFLFFCILGISVDLLYQGLAVLFGNEASPAVIVRKLLVDQFLFAPLIAIPFSTSAFLWKDAGFSFGRTVREGKNGVWIVRYVTLLLSCWAFWFPVVICVYAMPTNLQFCLYLCAQAAWGLLLLAMSGR